jgi:LPS O-antigen subunit length determinant protein (WzzB/FepE family)
MSSSKYTVIKASDLSRYLTPQERSQLAELIGKIAAEKAAKHAPDEQFFVLNMKDQYATHALEGYIRAVEADTLNQHNTGVVNAVSIARQMRAKAMLSGTQRLPT